MTAISSRPGRPHPALAVLILLVLIVGVVASIVPATAAEGEIRIIRDKLGVPHVFAATDADASYGVGYALAQDRLWEMHVLRLIAKGRLSELVGPLGLEMDQEVRFFTYTEEERATRYATYPKDIRENIEAFVDGINLWIAEVRSNPAVLPFEFTQFGEGPPEDWTVDDTIALGDALILAFGSGGGNELNHADLLNSLIETHGKKKGRAMFDDLVMTEDPDSPMTIPRGYPYEKRPTFARLAEAESRRELWDDARLSLEPPAVSGSRSPRPAAKGTMDQLALIPDFDAVMGPHRDLMQGLNRFRRVITFGSNAQIAGPKMSESRNSVQTGGPQVGYTVPQLLADFGMHGDTIDTTGMTFPGAGPAVLIGRGSGYAWTTTTGASDLTDTFVEKLNPDNNREYEFKGKFEPMDCRTETYAVKGAPFEQQEICRTRHGPVLAFDEANNVAYSLRYAWFNREVQTVEGFFRYNEVESVHDFATFANYLSSNHNMFYVDDQGNYGYWHPGNHLVRARGIDMRLPQDGTGGSEWRGLRPIQQSPHAVNFERGWLSNWNNQPVSGWKRERSYSLIDNSKDLENVINPNGPTLKDPKGGKVNPDGLLDYEDLNANLRYAAFKHHPHTFFKRFLPNARQLKTDQEKNALKVIREWNGFLTDNDNDGMYDSAGNVIVDEWLAEMRTLAFNDELGEELFGWSSQSLLWHALAGNDRVESRFDWLGKETPSSLSVKAFQAAVARLAEGADSPNPADWKEEAALEHYQRLNADLATDTAEGEASADNSEDSGRPGDVPDHIEMDRGTYNHIVVYLDRPSRSGELGESASKAGSVIPPGQNGFISPTGQEGPHYEDQLALYVSWTYKPMPMTLKEALAVMESEEVITRPPG